MMKIVKTSKGQVYSIIKGANHLTFLYLTSHHLQLDLDTSHEIFGKNYSVKKEVCPLEVYDDTQSHHIRSAAKCKHHMKGQIVCYLTRMES